MKPGYQARYHGQVQCTMHTLNICITFCHFYTIGIEPVVSKKSKGKGKRKCVLPTVLLEVLKYEVTGVILL